MFQITGQQTRGQVVRSILSRTSGFIAEAGFSHSLTPARNCTYGCTYCYVPTLGVYGGLKREDWEHWGQFTTFKENAAALLKHSLKAAMIIYCSPLVDPYQPAESQRRLMPGILEAVTANPPAVFTIQTRGPSICEDLPLLERLSQKTTLRVSFSLTTDREEIRRLYEPHCAPLADRLAAMRELRRAGILVHATLAPILPCDPIRLLDAALATTALDVIGDPLHIRAVKKRTGQVLRHQADEEHLRSQGADGPGSSRFIKKHGATTRAAAWRIAEHHDHGEWFDADRQQEIVERMTQHVIAAGRRFAVGPEAFRWLAQQQNPISPKFSADSASTK